ncbi:MAG: 16S rRNA (guanine(527)-N(7))-methyltransferase RsmG, partial [Planctomycetota bacterium]
LDIGSGAGFPGLVLAVVRPTWNIVSLEATEKKANFQKIVCDTLGLENTTILNGRAEAVAHLAQFRQVFDVVTARALAAMPVLTELSLGFVKINGLGLYWKGPSRKNSLPHRRRSTRWAVKSNRLYHMPFKQKTVNRQNYRWSYAKK